MIERRLVHFDKSTARHIMSIRSILVDPVGSKHVFLRVLDEQAGKCDVTHCAEAMLTLFSCHALCSRLIFRHVLALSRPTARR